MPAEPLADIRDLLLLHTPRGDFAVRETGVGYPVVLLHGTSASHAVWEPCAAALVDAARCIAVDQRGHGRSSKPATGYGGHDFADDVIAILDALQLDRAVVAGHSMGARNAWLVATRHADRVSGIVSVDYTPFVEQSVLDDLAVRVAGGDQVFTDVRAIEDYLQKRYPRIPAAAISRRARWGYVERAAGEWVPLAPAHALAQLVDGLRTPYVEEFEAVGCPMIHIRGIDSKIVSDYAWEAARPHRPNDDWIVDTDSDHYVAEERPDPVAQAIRQAIDLVHTTS